MNEQQRTVIEGIGLVLIVASVFAATALILPLVATVIVWAALVGLGLVAAARLTAPVPDEAEGREE